MPAYNPRFQYSNAMVNILNQLEYCRGLVEGIVLPVDISEKLRHEARIKATHYSTAIEGNPLTIEQVEGTVKKKLVKDKSEQEVRNYWNALNFLSRAGNRKITVTERYYDSLQMGLPVNYYDGRNDPELSPWIMFFLESMFKAYRDVVRATRSFTESAKVKLAGLGDKDKRLLLLALRFEKPLTPMTMANCFGVNPKTIHNWIREWLRLGLLEPASGSLRVRSYKIGDRYRSITIDIIENMMGWHHSGFNVYCGEAIWPSDQEGIERLAQYIVRAPISQERLLYIPASESNDGVARVINKGKNSLSP